MTLLYLPHQALQTTNNSEIQVMAIRTRRHDNWGNFHSLLKTFYKQTNWEKHKDLRKAVAAGVSENKTRVTIDSRHSQVLKKTYLVVGNKVEECICLNQMMLFSKKQTNENKNVIISLEKRIIMWKRKEKKWVNTWIISHCK